MPYVMKQFTGISHRATQTFLAGSYLVLLEGRFQKTKRKLLAVIISNKQDLLVGDKGGYAATFFICVKRGLYDNQRNRKSEAANRKWRFG